jgi:CAAX prenyl protease-like protein
VLMRFLRLVVVVPLVEEIFWRGFLLRYLINQKFTAIAVGTFSWLSFVVVTGLFGFAHSRADWIPALICGALYNLVAYRTRSLASCVIAHALTNLLLGLWIMQTRQWGFW